MHNDVLSLIRDSAILPRDEIANGYALNHLDLSKKNMLLDVLSRPDQLNVDDIHLDNLSCDVKAEDKAEAKKEHGRWIFELVTDERIKNSEYEASLSEYIKYFPGSVVGLDKRKYDKKMSMIRCGTNPIADHLRGYRQMIISFDLEKFSPHFDGRLHVEFDKLNAYLFGFKELAHNHYVHHKGNIHYYKKSIHHVIPKPAASFEGFSGKFYTLIHATVMGYAVHQCRRKNMLDAGAQLAVLIDDGLLKVDVREDDYEARCKTVFDEIRRVYKECGFVISLDKTFVSEHWSIFLHEIYYSSVTLTSLVKTFVKIDNISDKPISAFSDDHAVLQSTCSSAIKIGAHPFMVYYLYCAFFLDLVRRWKHEKKLLDINWTAWSFAPYGIGGLNMLPLIDMSGNLEQVQGVSYFGLIEQIKRRSEYMAEGFNKVLNQVMHTPLHLESHVSMGKLRIMGPIIKESRLKDCLTLKLLNMAQGAIKNILLGTRSVDLSYVIAATQNTDVPIFVRERLVDCAISTKLDRIADKFLKSRSVIKLLGLNKVKRIRFANQADFHNVTEKY
eukprot:TRINITY_DN4203_c0_g4_i1.p1 TRINITY_DN4203_c0_g4~~TRINITY_DN4203_c0_g4_i1.p1  ORF type:complete len:614 (-),score=20.85 TRINITY_DN4203_c0_g4_i1:145-1815(-)